VCPARGRVRVLSRATQATFPVLLPAGTENFAKEIYDDRTWELGDALCSVELQESFRVTFVSYRGGMRERRKSEVRVCVLGRKSVRHCDGELKVKSVILAAIPRI